MKIRRLFVSLSMFVATALASAATFRSAQPLPGNPLPDYPLALTFEGITRGRAYVGVSIDETGKVKDLLPLAYSHIRFSRASIDALREWRFTPATLDGEPVPVQTEIKFDYTLQGAVITTNIVNHCLYDAFDNLGDYALSYRPANPDRLDRTPQRIGGEDPHYATAAQKDGIRGRVQVRFYIDEKGQVRLPAATNAEANPYLLEQAVSAVRTWKFDPVTSGGRPVLVLAEQEFNFGDNR